MGGEPLKNKIMIGFGFLINVSLLVSLILIWSWCANPTIYVSHPLQVYFLPLFVVLIYVWMLWILALLFILVKRFFLAKNQFIFSYLCLLITITLLIIWTVDLVNHFMKPAFFTGWIPYFNMTVSKQLLFFWIPSHLNYLLLYAFIVLSKKGIDNIIDSKKTKSSPYWLVGWIVTFLSGCVWAFLLSFKEKYSSWALLFDKKMMGWEMWINNLNIMDWCKAFFGITLFTGVPAKYIFQSWLNQTEKWPNHVPMLYFAKIILLFVITCVVLVLLLQPDKPVVKLSESSAGATPATASTT